MIPLMMQENYKPQGWRKSLSGCRPCVLCACTVASSCLLTWDDFAGSGPDHGHEAVVRGAVYAVD